jgi:hypothetical protein
MDLHAFAGIRAAEQDLSKIGGKQAGIFPRGAKTLPQW